MTRIPPSEPSPTTYRGGFWLSECLIGSRAGDAPPRQDFFLYVYQIEASGLMSSDLCKINTRKSPFSTCINIWST
jgi:hypothetical protein